MKNGFNGLAIVAVSVFNGANATIDKNGKSPVMLQPVAGRIPNKMIISGTVAESNGLLPGRSYLVSFTEQPEDENFGRQFSWTNAGPVTAMEIMQSIGALGTPDVVDVLDLSDNDDDAAATKAAEELKAKATEAKAGKKTVKA